MNKLLTIIHELHIHVSFKIVLEDITHLVDSESEMEIVH